MLSVTGNSSVGAVFCNSNDYPGGAKAIVAPSGTDSPLLIA